MLRLRSGQMGLTVGSTVLGMTLGSPDSSFLFNCSQLDKIQPTQGQDSAGDPSGSDRILASAFSPKGDYFAVTDDNKRLVLFQTEPTWVKVSVRWVSRRCTSLTFSTSGTRILVADKSGDLFSFSVTEPEKDGRLELGHLSMLLDVVVSPDGNHVITCDRDEKIRISRMDAPHVISAFCLGHGEFVTQLLVLSGSQKLLLSGSGDGTLRLWEYETGKEIQNWNLSSLQESLETHEKKKIAVSKISCCRRGEYIAVLCDCVPGIYLFSVHANRHVRYTQYIPLSGVPWDLDFDDSATLWLLSGVLEEPLVQYRQTEGSWQMLLEPNDLKRVSEVIIGHWKHQKDSLTSEDRYSGLYKVVCDNMASYLRKKEVRLDRDKRKVTPEQVESPTKVQKTES
ncbi:tRNA (guanine-N(7)-)-methyltransferase non-catalytic subunit WDR4 [Discoglossus pictus]